MTSTQIQPRILVIDNEERVREDLCAIFEPLGYEVQAATGLGPALLEDAKNKAGEFRPHVAIVDMRLVLDSDSNDRSGVELVKTLDPAHCILYSSYISLELSRELAGFKAAGWIGKQEPPLKLVDLVNRVAKESSADRKKFRIDKNSVDFDKESRALLGRELETPPNLIEDVLSQVFPNELGVKVDTIPGAVKTPMSVNRGRSLILKVRRAGMAEPFIVKLAKKEDIIREHVNYKKHIEGNLKGGFYAHLIGEPKFFWDVGAVVYTFIGYSDQNIVFSAYYQREDDSDKILAPLQTFFGEVWHELYSGDKKGEIQTSLYESYNKHLKLVERLAGFSDQTEYRAFRGINIDMLNPIPWVLKHGTDSAALSARWAVTHGDLHGDNIFVDDNHAWAIDFERSGEGHILRDFTELEVDILTRLAWKKNEKDLGEFFYLLTCLVDPRYFREVREPTDQLGDQELRKAFDVVKGLRSLAKNITNFSDVREYIWSLLFDSVFVATYKGGEPAQRERALLYGSILCSCLQNWGSEWPLDEWKPFLSSVQSKSINISSQQVLSSSKVTIDNDGKYMLDTENQAEKPSPQMINIIGGGIFLILAITGVVILWWAMSLFGITLNNALITFILITLFAIIIFTLLGLVTGQAALNALMKMFSTLFNKGMKSTDKMSPHHRNVDNDETEG